MPHSLPHKILLHFGEKKTRDTTRKPGVLQGTLTKNERDERHLTTNDKNWGKELRGEEGLRARTSWQVLF